MLKNVIITKKQTTCYGVNLSFVAHSCFYCISPFIMLKIMLF